MRELKFRAWNTARNCWTSRVELDGGWGKPMFMHGEVENDNGYQTDSTIIEQYTGFKDMNSNEIYEGDIVREHTSLYIAKFEIAWREDKAGWFGFTTDDYTCPLCNIEHVEVIGNIHENPELLEAA